MDAAHSFYVQDNTLFVEYNGNPYFNSAYLINAGGDTLFVGKIDSLILNPGLYLLCSFFSNGQCQDSICNWFQVMTPNCAEICNDGLDNDLDGFVDFLIKIAAVMSKVLMAFAIRTVSIFLIAFHRSRQG